MPNGKDQLIKGSRWVVRVALIANRLFFFAVVTALLLATILPGPFAAFLIQQSPGVDAHSESIGLRWLMVLGAAMAVATESLLHALTQIIASASLGDPFVASNARKLQTIGWSLLALQLLDVPGDIIARLFPSLGSAAPNITFSPGGWLAVLMVFILSRVFAVGSAMKDDLEGTV